METSDILRSEWGYVLSLLPEGFEESSYTKLALVRRREVGCAGDLLRLCLAYGLCDMSLRQVAAWAATIGLGDMSDVAVLKRVRNSDQWLGHIVGQWLVARGLTTNVPGGQVRIIDATALSMPGSKGTDYRLHLHFDLAESRIVNLELTDASGGEHLRRHRIAPGEIVLVDRGYAHRAGIGSVLRRGAHVVVRAVWSNMALRTVSGRRLDILPLLETVGVDEIGDWDVCLHDGDTQYAMRLVAVKKTEAAAEKERRRLRRIASRNMTKLSPKSLKAAGYIYVLTDLTRAQLPAVQVLELYRLRWQIELVFKRLKSLLGLGNLRAKNPRLARTYLLAKILGALIIEEMSGRALSFFPWGFPLPHTAAQPLAGLYNVG